MKHQYVCAVAYRERSEWPKMKKASKQDVGTHVADAYVGTSIED